MKPDKAGPPADICWHIEKQLEKQISSILQPLAAQETQRLLQELKIQQLELEMQNEELRRSKEILEVAQERFVDLYDFAPVGYCMVSEKGLVLEANFTAANLLGMARKELIQQPMSRFILKEDQDIYYYFDCPEFEQCPVFKGKKACYYRNKDKDVRLARRRQHEDTPFFRE